MDPNKNAQPCSTAGGKRDDTARGASGRPAHLNLLAHVAQVREQQVDATTGAAVAPGSSSRRRRTVRRYRSDRARRLEHRAVRRLRHDLGQPLRDHRLPW